MIALYQNILLILMKKYFTAFMVIISIAAMVFVLRKNNLRHNSLVSITNTRWQKVHIQVRAGYNPDPSHNKLIFDQYLVKGQSRTFSVGHGNDIVYRRDQDPNHADSVHFTSWTYAKFDDSSACMIDNP